MIVFAWMLTRPSAASTRSSATRRWPGKFVNGGHAVDTRVSDLVCCAVSQIEWPDSSRMTASTGPVRRSRSTEPIRRYLRCLHHFLRPSAGSEADARRRSDVRSPHGRKSLRRNPPAAYPPAAGRACRLLHQFPRRRDGVSGTGYASSPRCTVLVRTVKDGYKRNEVCGRLTGLETGRGHSCDERRTRRP